MTDVRNKNKVEQNGMENTLDKKPKERKLKKPIFKWALSVILILLGFIGYKWWQFKSQMEERRVIMQEQLQVMIDYWIEQGLTEEEIEAKLKEKRPDNMGDIESSILRSVMRTFRHATGTGPGMKSK